MNAIKLFLRPSRPDAFSIENLFQTLYPYIQKGTKAELHILKSKSTGVLNRWRLLQEVKKNKSLRVNHITGDINFVALFLNRRTTILTIHDVESLQRPNPIASFLLNLFWLKLPVQAAGKITVVSQQTRMKLLEKVAVSPEKIIVIPNPVSNLYQYCYKEFNKEKPNLLQIGTKYNKNLEMLIPALAGLSCTLTIVGKLSVQQEALLKQYRIEYCNKTGLSNEELLDEYIHADIVTFVSTFEGFGMPIIEANAVGRVVLTSNISAMPEVAADAAYLVNPFDCSAIREAILELIDNDLLREQLIERGVHNAKRYSPEIIAGMYLALYESML